MIRLLTPTEGMDEAVARLQAGKLVAFPTETVYGLGANALDSDAVAQIFLAKGRPATNPVIVHVATLAQARRLARVWTEQAETLARAHWPGPLTLVVERAESVPDIVTAGGDTVGIRIPAHPVALELLTRVGLPIAAPSANRSEEISPTRAEHVAQSLGGFVDDLLIIDGGACQVGIESTVVDVTVNPPRVLRPGMIVLSDATTHQVNTSIARSPGQMTRHYAPQKPTRVIDYGAPIPHFTTGWRIFLATESPADCATRLYATLRAWDGDPEVVGIVLCLPPDLPEWAAICDRLRRAGS
jgi:L-threonylcarbamoyladenylate synthase